MLAQLGFKQAIVVRFISQIVQVHLYRILGYELLQLPRMSKNNRDCLQEMIMMAPTEDVTTKTIPGIEVVIVAESTNVRTSMNMDNILPMGDIVRENVTT